jgi:hypothetical protein
MQEPTEDDAAPILPTETASMSDDPNMNHTVKTRRKAATRTLPFELTAEELLVSQDEDNPARKKPRLEEPLPTTPDEAARKTAPPDFSLGPSPPNADNDDANASADPLKYTQPNAGATRATLLRWTLEEDAKLTHAVANTSKKKRGKTDWPAVSELIPGRTNIQCWHRWHDVLDPSIALTAGGKGKWTAVEDKKLKDAVQTQGGKNWVAISALVPARTKIQCRKRWKEVLDPRIALTGGSKGKWAEDEDSKLMDAVQTHGDKDWVAISLLVPGRTKKQCNNRWHDTLDPSIGRASGRKGKWTAVEESQLNHALQTHTDKDWVAISLLVPGRTKKQCFDKYNNRSTVWGKEHGNLKKAPALGQDPSTTNSWLEIPPPGTLPSMAHFWP